MLDRLPDAAILHWLLAIELIVLAVAAMFHGVAKLIAEDQNDPIRVWCETFWRNFLYPPMVMELDSFRLSPKRSYGSSALPSGGGTAAPSDDDAVYGRVKRDRDGRIVTSTLELLVVPHCVKDQVAGVEDGGLKINVRGEAGDGRTNKALIELVSNAIGVKPYQVTITKGHYHPRKTVQIQGLRPDELETKLESISPSE